ncbi:MAG: hypothetical protein ABI824_11150 [Acidobacteriota bacterium]
MRRFSYVAPLALSLLASLTLAFTAVGQTPAPAKAAAKAAPAAKGKAYAPPRLFDGKPDLNGIWEVRGKVDADIQGKLNGKNIIVEPADGKIPYKADALAKKLKLNASKATEDPIHKCWMPGIPRLMYSPYPFRIAQAANQPIIAVLSQYVHTVRNINMGGEHLDGLENWLGDSRGKWEGDTLVVNVQNFNDMTWLDGAGSLHSTDLKVVERFTRTGPETITYEATVTDPSVLTKPFKISLPLMLHTEKNFQIMEYECFADKEGPTYTVGDKKDPEHGR